MFKNYFQFLQFFYENSLKYDRVFFSRKTFHKFLTDK